MIAFYYDGDCFFDDQEPWFVAEDLRLEPLETNDGKETE